MKTDKPWGVSELLVSTDTTELHRIIVKENGESSFHFHQHKYNMIYLESGNMLIIHDDKTPTKLAPGNRIIIAPGEKHKFIAITCCIAYEYYWVGCQSDDIVRLE